MYVYTHTHTHARTHAHAHARARARGFFLWSVRNIQLRMISDLGDLVGLHTCCLMLCVIVINVNVHWKV
jgi:ABC-type nickel/cobalt efflux system permease component RcnA